MSSADGTSLPLLLWRFRSPSLIARQDGGVNRDVRASPADQHVASSGHDHDRHIEDLAQIATATAAHRDSVCPIANLGAVVISSFYTDPSICTIARQKRVKALADLRAALVARYGPTRLFGIPEPAPVRVSCAHHRPRFVLLMKSRGLMRSRAERLVEAQGGCCYLCHEPFRADAPATQDHVMPRARGGKNRLNILMAHGPCNIAKADRLPTEAELAYLRAVNVALANDEPVEGAPGSGEARKRADFASAVQGAKERRLSLAA